MNAKKFTQENGMENISIEIKGKREPMEELLERFQHPIKEKINQLSLEINAVRVLMQRNPMSPMTEMEYLRDIKKRNEFIKILEAL